MRRRAPDLRRLEEVAPLLVDPVVGVIRGVEEVRREAGAPDFFHFGGQACDTSAFAPQRNFAYTGGASVHRGTALAKAVGEAVERYCAAIYDIDDFPLASFDEADFAAVEPEAFALFSPEQYASPGFPYVPFERDTPVRWAPMVDLSTGETVHVPAARIYIPWLYPPGEDSPIDQPISTGLACHLSWAEAACGAVCEVVERDAALIAWQARVSPPQLRVETLSEANYDLVSRFERTGAQVRILDLTLDARIPTVMAVLVDPRPAAPALVFAPACSADPEAAVRKALEELAHTRRFCQFVKTGAPRIVPDPPEWPSVHGQRDHLNLYVDHASLPLVEFFFASKARVDFEELPNASTGDPARDLEVLVSRVASTGERVLAAELTTPDVGGVGLHVARAVIPGYQSLHMGFRNRSLGGRRLWEVPQRLGHPGITREGGDNPAPHPYP
jgi:ribosomal protein S12 methylthiotransferase accessory factor